ncbi:MAG TPA: sulfotransferase [Acidimicrobiales bacterium]|jgi:hypothetical protein|nr:sulfotransferase [Acidimicrobiales bacterium]
MDILGIVGTSRCGSTVFASALGTLDGYVNIGETRIMWERVVMGQPCSCGAPMEDCPFWRDIFTAAQVDARQMFGAPVDSTEYLRSLKRLYAAVASASGAHTIIDTSKNPEYFRSVSAIDGVNVRFVHMIRDPRGVLASSLRGWRGRGRVQAPNPSLGRCARSAIAWQRRNTDARRLRHARSVQRISYEEFVREPDSVLSRVVGSPVSGPFVVKQSHVAAGNPSRMQHGPIDLSPDDDWESFTTTRQMASYVFGLPWTAVLGYPPMKRQRRESIGPGT